MKEKLYKRRGWARRAAAKLKWHTVVEMPYRYGFMVRPMTGEEKAAAQRQISFNQIIREVYGDSIRELMNQSTAPFGRLRSAKP